MPLKLTIPTPPPESKPTQESIGLKITKTLDGNLLIVDHQYLDILVLPTSNRVLCMPKALVEKDVYDYQKALMNSLFRGGVTNARNPQAGIQFGVVETTYPAESEVDTLQAVLYQISEFIVRERAQDFPAEEYDQHIEDRFVDPTDEDSTAYGEIPPYQDTPEGQQDNVPYSYAGYGYYF
jgi:hypothetical protein